MALTVEEGMIRNIANRVISDGIGAFDVELGDFQAAGQIIDQVYKTKRIAYIRVHHRNLTDFTDRHGDCSCSTVVLRLFSCASPVRQKPSQQSH